MNRSHASLTEMIALAHELADLSGPAILPHFRRRLAVDNKAAPGSFDPVTKADRAAERVISRTLAQRCPEHGFSGEEFGDRPGKTALKWVVDPIDGTRAFIMGLPIWGTLIGLLDGDRPVLGMMDQPYTRERFWSGDRASYFRDGSGRQRRLRVRPCSGLANAVFSTTHPDLFAAGHETKAFREIKSRARMTRYGGDCYAYCLLASGHIDLIIESGLEPYDIVALIPIIERAGGRVTAWDGGSAIGGGRVVAAGDPRLHAETLSMLS